MIRLLLALATLVPVPALAADVAPADGCEDAQFDLNGACVHPTATVAGASIGARASIGEEVDLAAGVTIAPGVILAGKSAGGLSTQPVGTGTLIGRRTAVGTDADIGASNAIGAGVIAGDRLTTGTSVTIGYGTVLGDDVDLGNMVDIGNLATVNGDVGLGSSVGRMSQVDGTLLESVRVAPSATIMAGATLQDDVRIRRGAVIQSGAVVEAGARVGRGAIVGANATVTAGAVVRNGAELCDGTDLGSVGYIERGMTHPPAGCSFSDCKAIKDAGQDSGNHTYLVDPSGTGSSITVYCDMATDGGGWTLVASNHSSSSVFPGGTSRSGLFLTTAGYDASPSPTSDYLIGPAMDDLVYTETRLFADRADNGVDVVDFKIAQSCHECWETNNFSTRTDLLAHTVTNVGCGLANHCNVDGQYADTYSGGFNSNSNQRTVGFVCTKTTPDPSTGAYVGHGATEGSNEGSYFIPATGGSCTHQDMNTHTTWVR